MTDVESSSSERRPLVNPYTAGDGASPANAALANKIYRVAVLLLSLYGLHTFKVYWTILHSPKVQHEAFKIGLGTTIAMLGVKAYVEIYAGKICKEEINYKNFPQSTHAVIVGFLLSSLSFHIALWPAFGWMTLAIMTIVGYGVVLQFCLLVPTYVQNVVSFVLLTFFLQEYA